MAAPIRQTAHHAELVEAKINGLRGKMRVDMAACPAAVDASLAARFKPMTPLHFFRLGVFPLRAQQQLSISFESLESLGKLAREC